MKLQSKDRWISCWQSVRGRGDPEVWYARLASAYAEPHRHYHNQQHIAECLAEFDQARHLAKQSTAVEFALWFHDAVYDPRASDNEERSAELAACCLDHAGLPNTFINSVRKLVMVTKRHEAEPDSDEAVLVDVDLGILGQGYKRFAEYEDQIRQEYAWVPNPVFVSRRAEILERFLARKQIFATKLFHDKYELRARRNLETSLLRLKNPSA